MPTGQRGKLGGMTNEEFGRRVGVTHSMASRMRNGFRLPSVEVLRKIHTEFGVSLEELTAAHVAGPAEFGRLLRQRCFRAPQPDVEVGASAP